MLTGYKSLKYNYSMTHFSPILDEYLEELLLWNKSFNLIGKSTEKEIWKTHIENSLEILSFLENEDCPNVVDIGSGAGLPSIPLSIFLPKKIFYLRLNLFDFLSSYK